MYICPICSGELVLVGTQYVCETCGQPFSQEAIEKLGPYTPGTVFPRSCPAIVAGEVDIDNNLIINPHGVTSFTEIGVGIYEVLLENPTPTAQYSVIGMAQDRGSYACRAFEHEDDVQYKTTTSFRIRTEAMIKNLQDSAGWIPFRCNFYFKLGW